jgi:hypothetical protein
MLMMYKGILMIRVPGSVIFSKVLCLSADSQNDVLKAMLTDGVKNKEALRASDYIGFSKAWAGRL